MLLINYKNKIQLIAVLRILIIGISRDLLRQSIT